jgi:hypothetical protein
MTTEIDRWHDQQMWQLQEERDRSLAARSAEEKRADAWMRRCLQAEAERDTLRAACEGMLEVPEHNDPWTRTARRNAIASLRAALAQA